MKNLANKIFLDYYNTEYTNVNKLKKYMFYSKKNLILILYIASKSKITMEDACYNISPKVISRSTIQNILKEGLANGFLEKKINPKDKRGKYYNLNENGKKILEEWINDQKAIFGNIDNIKLAC
jgi:DNA-binding MarR family transcriptional regulator